MIMLLSISQHSLHFELEAESQSVETLLECAECLTQPSTLPSFLPRTPHLPSKVCVRQPAPAHNHISPFLLNIPLPHLH